MRKILLAFLLLFVAGPAAAQNNIVILTGSTSGVYYPLGNALSGIFLKAIPGVRANVQVTQGSVENLKLLQEGDGELAFSLGDTVTAAWNGNKDAGFVAPLKKLRGIASIYPNYVQIVVSEASGIKSLADLKGKRVSVGPKQSGTELNARAIFAAAGVSYSDFARTDYLPFGQSAKLIERGELDATLQSAGLGVDSIRQLATAVPTRLVPIPASVVAKIGDPTFVPSIIPTRTYEGQSSDVETAAIVNFLITREGISSEVAYAMTKSIFDNLNQLVQRILRRRDYVEECQHRHALPLHPGALSVSSERWASSDAETDLERVRGPPSRMSAPQSIAIGSEAGRKRLVSA